MQLQSVHSKGRRPVNVALNPNTSEKILEDLAVWPAVFSSYYCSFYFSTLLSRLLVGYCGNFY